MQTADFKLAKLVLPGPVWLHRLLFSVKPPPALHFLFFLELMAEKRKDERLCDQEEEEPDFSFFSGAGKNLPEEKFLSDRTKANMIKYIKDKVLAHQS